MLCLEKPTRRWHLCVMLSCATKVNDAYWTDALLLGNMNKGIKLTDSQANAFVFQIGLLDAYFV